jgi:hypothetical protein
MFGIGISSSLFNLRHALQLGYEEDTTSSKPVASRAIDVPTKSWEDDKDPAAFSEGSVRDEKDFTIQDPATVWTITDEDDGKQS